MPSITFEEGCYSSNEGESVLDTLLRHQADVPFSCKVGACHTCLLRRTDGPVSLQSQPGLRSSLSSLNYFLACQYFPDSDIAIALPDAAQICGRATVTCKDQLSDDVCGLHIETATPLYYHAGQYINLRRADGLMRSYSLASVPQRDASLQMHIRRHENGKLSNWIHDALRQGDEIEFMGPYGECFYQPGHSDENLVLVGTGTGLAPLIGIVGDALQSGHRGQIVLYHGGRNRSDFYQHDRLNELAGKHANFRYIPCLSGQTETHGCTAGRADDVAFSEHPDLKEARLYLCGHPVMVHSAKKIAYLNGAALDHIHADAFEMADLRNKPR